MKKIAINNCYGGFGLSPEGCKLYLEKKGKESFFYKHDYSRDMKTTTYRKLDNPENDLFFDVLTKDMGDIFDGEDYPDDYDFYYRNVERDDVDLISVIEELGNKASGRCAELKVVEIPDDVSWTIEEYDGNEWVAETHDTWS